MMAREIKGVDVLVVGGGLAGCWAAIRAKDLAKKVILVDKSAVARSGASTFAAGVMLGPMPGDNLKTWMKEIVERGEYMADQRWVEILLEDQCQRLKDLDEWGVPFERDAEGRPARILGRAHENTRIVMFHGKSLMEWMKKQVQAKGVEIHERVMVIDFLTSDGKSPTQGSVAGAVGLDTRTGEYVIFESGAVVISAGAISSKTGGGFTDNLTGDGVVMAFRAGAELMDMEFCFGGNITCWERKYGAAGINMIQGHGAWFLNNKGERFMERYDPILKERSRLSTICQAFVKEALEGRGPIFIDMTQFSQETIEKFKRVIPLTMRIFDEAGIDPRKKKVECTPRIGVGSQSGDGGIAINTDCETNIPGLYAAGVSARNLPQGTYAVGGVNLAFCNVSGYRAGENAAKYAAGIKEKGINPKQVEVLQETINFPLRQQKGLEPDELFAKIHEVVLPTHVSLFKSEEKIKQVLQRIEKIKKEDLPNVKASDPHELIKANEVRNFITCAELIYTAALQRKESRSWHYREEYPYRDDAHWLKRFIMKRKADGLEIYSVPIDASPFRPEKMEKIPHLLSSGAKN